MHSGSGTIDSYRYIARVIEFFSATHNTKKKISRRSQEKLSIQPIDRNSPH
jgi:hypothetical protein